MEIAQLSKGAPGAAGVAVKAGTASGFSKSQYYEESKREGPHKKIVKRMEKRVANGRIFGQSWKEVLGFFAPFGTRNSFWSRLNKSQSFSLFWVFNDPSLNDLLDKELSETTDVGGLKVSDVDAAVNMCALVCALLLSVPCAIMSSGPVGGKDDGWQAWLEGMYDGTTKAKCQLPYSDFCLIILKENFDNLYQDMLICFYTSLFTLITSVFYYMCRPAESCNCSSLNELLEAFTLEVRYKIRNERRLQTDVILEVPPEVPFSSPIEEMEVFIKAKFLSLNELEEQKDQEFYMWYRSEKFALCFCACAGVRAWIFYVFSSFVLA